MIPNLRLRIAEAKVQLKMKLDKSEWIPLRDYMDKCVPKIVYTKVQNLNDESKIQPAFPYDYKKIQDILTSKAVLYHTFTLPENKLLRGVPTEFDEKDIKKIQKIKAST
ncbi:hypothetical protein JTB14_030687 [Gonioctena quinquepunctata]|nr:hypothetical protein JTB14_030687 [Gonioctena quinquepunctata]